MKTCLALFLLLPISTPAQPGAPGLADATNVLRLTPAYLREMAAVMRSNHPALRALEARVRAAAHATNAVRTWPDPDFTFGGVIASSRGPHLEEEGNLVYGLNQKLPLFGRPAAARAQARAEAGVAVARQALQFQVLRRDLARALFQAAYRERMLELGRQDLTWIETLSATAEERYRAGGGSQVEVLRLQNERSKRADRLQTDVLERDLALLAANRLLGRDLETSLPRFDLPEVALPVRSSESLANAAVRWEPRLRVLAREAAAAEAQVVATRKGRLPEVSAGVEGRQYAGDGGFREGMFTVGLSLPWFNGGKYRSDLARDRARLEASQLDAADLAQGVREEVHQRIVAIDAARREAVLYRDEIIPRSEQALESAHAGWMNHRGLFLDVMDARRMLVEARWLYAKAVAEQHQALSDLALACGLEDVEDVFALPASPATAPPGKEGFQ